MDMALSSDSMSHMMSLMISICAGILVLFLVFSIVKDGIEYAKGYAEGGIVKIIGKVVFLMVVVGLVFVATNMLPEMTSNMESNTIIVDNSSTEEPVQAAEKEVVTEEPPVTEQVTEQPTTQAATEAPAPAMSDKEFNDKWSYAVKHEYDFYYMSSNGNSVKRNPAYIDSSLYRVEFDDTNHIVRLYDK